ncbi:MAG: hypothetical protein KA140_03410 [Caldisericia bacterium]|nr:hypothetical protein [Caldisericia bacterium]
MKRALFAWLIGFVILSSAAYGSEGNIVNPPLSVGKPLLVTPSIYRLTDKYVVTKDSDGLSFLDVQTGEPTQAEDFEDDTPSQTYLRLPDGDLSVKSFTFTQNWNGDEFISTDSSQALRLNDGLFCRFLKNNDDKALFSVWNANNKNMLWENEIAVPTNENLPRAEAIDDLLLVNVGNACHFYGLLTGQLKLSIQDVGFFRCQRWENFLLVGKFLIDIDKMESVRKFDNESIMLDSGRVYFLPENELDWKSIDLKTGKEENDNLDMPQGSYTRGICNGLFLCWNDRERSAQIIDPMTAEVYFSHQISQIHSQRWGFYENDRHILFFDSAQMSCFDSMSKEMLWEKEFVTSTQDLGNGFFWEPVMDESAVRVFGLSNPKKSVNISIDKGHLMPFIFPSDSCVLSLDVAGQGYQRILRRFDWDGKVSQLDELPDGNENLIKPFVFKCIVYAWVENGQTATLFKHINNGWSKVYQSNVYQGHSYFCQSDRFLAFYSDKTHIKVLNLGTNIAKSIEAKEHSQFCFAGGLLVVFFGGDSMVIEPSTCKVLDENAGQIAGSDKDTLYMVNGQTFKTFIKGKLTEKILDAKAIDKYGKYSASNGLLLADNLLFDRDGRFCQELPESMFGTTIVTVNGKTCIRQDRGNQINIYEVVESAKFSISNDSGRIVIKNIGKTTLKGECWVEPSVSLVCAKLKEPIVLDIAPEESFMLDVGESQSTVFFSTNGFLDSSNSDTNKKPAWLGSISLQNGEVINIFETN